MNLEKIKQGIELAKMLDGETCTSEFPIENGKNVFIRTVTMYYTGKLKKVCGQFLTLTEAAWIPDTGRFYGFLKEGKANEVEPFINEVHIPLGSLIDVTEWKGKLPSEQK